MEPETNIHLSVTIPAYNEAERIGGSLQTVLSYLDSQPQKSEVIVVADGCHDGTATVCLRAAQGHSTPLRVLEHATSRGKGYSVRRGMLESRGTFVLFSDADLSTPIEESARLIAALQDGYDVAIASRWLPASDVQVRQGAMRRSMGRVFNSAVRLTGLAGIHDSQCGFKCFRRDVARKIFQLQRIEGFSFDVEVLLIARKHSYRIAEIPVTWINDPRSKVRAIRDSGQMFVDLLRIRANALRGAYDQ